MSRKSILFIAKFIPAPAFDGGALRNKAWLNFFLKNYDVILVGFWNKKYKNARIAELKHQNLKIYGFDFNVKLGHKFLLILKLFFNNKSFLLNKYYDSKFSGTISEIISKEKVDFIFCSELSTIIYVNKLNKALPIYFDDHNVEFKLLERMAENSKGIKKFLLNKESKIIKGFEGEAIHRAAKTFTVSEIDKELLFQTDNFGDKITVVNNTFTDYHGFKVSELSDRPKLIFTGNLNWLPNKIGLSHFLKNILPIVVKSIPDVSLDIVGSNLSGWLVKQAAGLPANFFNDLDETKKGELIVSAWVGIAPLYFASGSRIKILELWSYGKTVVTTKIGLEGLPCPQGTIVVDSDQAFIESLIDILKHKEKLVDFGSTNYIIFKQNYSQEVVYEDSFYNTFSTK